METFFNDRWKSSPIILISPSKLTIYTGGFVFGDDDGLLKIYIDIWYWEKIWAASYQSTGNSHTIYVLNNILLLKKEK